MTKPFARALALSLLLLPMACSESKNTTPENTAEPQDYSYSTPPNTDDGWQTASLDASKIQTAPIEAMVRAVRAGAYSGIESILVARNGNLVLEEYFGDQKREDLHTMRSASKALTSALVGIAIDKGFIPSVDTRALPYFPEYEDRIANWDERKNDITVGHLLSMTSGVRGNEDEMYPTDDWIKFYFDQSLVAAPGETFSYATSGVVTLGNIITRASGLRVPAFTDMYLFGPMGINQYRWPITNSQGNQGLAMTGGGLNLRSRDMLKFGQLYLNGGMWGDEHLISESWIQKSTARHATSDLYGEDFGYLWRMIDREIGGRKLRSYEAWGNGGQFIMVFPALELAAVFTGNNFGKFPEMEQPFKLMDDYILPAVE